MVDTERTREEWIILRCQLKDPDAFRELVELMEERLRYYVKSIIHNEADVYDVLQQVWLSVFRNIHRLRDAKKFRTWIYRIAHGKAVSQIRHEKAVEKLNRDLAEQSRQWDEREEWNPEDVARVHVLLRKMNRIHREVLTLHFLEDMKYDEIAQVVGCSVGTIKSRIHHAKRMLRDLMEPVDND